MVIEKTITTDKVVKQRGKDSLRSHCHHAAILPGGSARCRSIDETPSLVAAETEQGCGRTNGRPCHESQTAAHPHHWRGGHHLSTILRRHQILEAFTDSFAALVYYFIISPSTRFAKTPE